MDQVPPPAPGDPVMPVLSGPPSAGPAEPPPPQQVAAGPPPRAGGDLAAQDAPQAPPQDASRVSEGARLLATQMAVAGSTRDEIAWRLREEFAIHDASAILDEIGI
jgi:hypothetical protein